MTLSVKSFTLNDQRDIIKGINDTTEKSSIPKHIEEKLNNQPLRQPNYVAANDGMTETAYMAQGWLPPVPGGLLRAGTRSFISKREAGLQWLYCHVLGICICFLISSPPMDLLKIIFPGSFHFSFRGLHLILPAKFSSSIPSYF